VSSKVRQPSDGVICPRSANRMNDFDNEIIKIINKNYSELLDPFHIVFPLPGVWHFAFGSISAFIAFGGSYSAFFFSTSVNELFVLGSVQGFGFLCIILIILCIRGYLFPAKLVLLYAIMSLVFLSTKYFFGFSLGIFELVMFIFGLIALYLLTRKMNRTFLIIMAVRNQKIRESKKDGTYKQKRAEARAKWNMK